jgi:hypothetical protein
LVLSKGGMRIEVDCSVPSRKTRGPFRPFLDRRRSVASHPHPTGKENRADATLKAKGNRKRSPAARCIPKLLRPLVQKSRNSWSVHDVHIDGAFDTIYSFIDAILPYAPGSSGFDGVPPPGRDSFRISPP